MPDFAAAAEQLERLGAPWGSSSGSTTSGPATRRWSGSAACPRTASRSRAPSWSGCSRRRAARRSCTRAIELAHDLDLRVVAEEVETRRAARLPGPRAAATSSRDSCSTLPMPAEELPAALPGGRLAFLEEPPVTTSFAKSRMKVLLLEGVHDRAVENFKRHGYTTIERHKKALAGDELKDGDRRRPLRRHPLADAPHRGRHRGRAQAPVHRRLLHRHQPDRPRRGHEARHPRLQRALLEHALRGRAGAGGDRLPAARHPGQERPPAPRGVGQVGGRRPRGAGQDPRHRGLREHRHPALGDGGGARHERLLLRRRHQAAPGQRDA